MTHTLAFSHETEVDAVFVCSTCGQPIGFNKIPESDPHAVLVDGVWTAPETHDQWMSPCTQ